MEPTDSERLRRIEWAQLLQILFETQQTQQELANRLGTKE
jgi:hypothetical protein